jgi:hypothetical protein
MRLRMLLKETWTVWIEEQEGTSTQWKTWFDTRIRCWKIYSIKLTFLTRSCVLLRMSATSERSKHKWWPRLATTSQKGSWTSKKQMMAEQEQGGWVPKRMSWVWQH